VAVPHGWLTWLANGVHVMCLAVPMPIVSVQGHLARCEARGVQREVSLTLLGDGPVGVGDHVLVHVGYAIQIIRAADADTTFTPGRWRRSQRS
jgi:hydrogenase expression/formation protein HypC